MPKRKRNNVKKQQESDLATALTKASVARTAARVPNDDLITRERLSKATAPAEIEYLRSMSPAAADAWESGRQVA
jgi:hypothetical protein